MLAATEGDLAKRRLIGLFERAADDGKSLRLHVVFWDDEVRLLEILRRKLIEADELGHLDGVLRGNAQLRQFFGLNEDILALAVFEAFHDVVLFYGRTGLVRRLLDCRGEHLLMPYPFAGCAADLVEAHLALRFSSDVQLDHK